MEYRLFTIVRYNYRDYNTPSKPNMHARVKTMQKQKETSTVTKRTSERQQQQDSKKILKKLEGRRPTGGKKAEKR